MKPQVQPLQPDGPAIPPIEAFLAEVRNLLGEEHVVESDAELELRSRETGHVANQPRALVYPGNTDEVRAVVLCANRYVVKLHVGSRGLNYGYGGNNFTDRTAVVIVLSRMDRVVHVDDELAYAVIEPGVSYEQLNRHLKERGHRLWIDCTDGPPTGSVLGNALDRGIGETPYGDHFGNLCGMEIVLPDGRLIHTGGSSPARPLRTWHTHKWGVGPYVEGLFTQSNYGIVTRAGIWLMPEPASYNSYIFELDSDEHLGTVVDKFRQLALRGVVSSKLHLISDFVSLTILTQRHSHKIQGPHMSAASLANLRKQHGFARWSGGAALYGDAGQVALQRRILKRTLGPFGRLMFFSDRSAALLTRLLDIAGRFRALEWLVNAVTRRSVLMMRAIPQLHGILKGIPSIYFLNHAYFKIPAPRPTVGADPARDGVGLTWFAPILPFRGVDVVPYLQETRAMFERHGFDFYMAMLMLNPRSVICLMGILFDKADPDEGKRAGELYDELLDHLYENNLQQYRNGIAGWPRTFETAHDFAAFLGTLKIALDPRDVLAPRKYGIPSGPS